MEEKSCRAGEQQPQGEPQQRAARTGARSVSGAPERVTGLDLSHQGLKSLSVSLFLLSGLRELLLNNNELETIPREIHLLRSLEKLHLGHNKIRAVPPELGRMVWLRELHLNDNLISTVPMELGSLHGLEVLSLGNNPLIAPFSVLSRDRTLVHFCRENNTAYAAPADRAWVDTVLVRAPHTPVSAGTYNILCNFHAARCTYAPTWVLSQDLRKETVLQNIVAYNVDVLCLQEIEAYAYCDFYRDQLAMRLDYDSAFLPRGRAGALADRRTVDGCATFWKRGRFRLAEQISVDFAQRAATDPRLAQRPEALVRHSRKDNVALITVLERREEDSVLIVANAHLHWDPEYSDVQLFQAVLALEEVERVRGRYSGAPVLLMGDFNSLRDSLVYALVVCGGIGKFAAAESYLDFHPSTLFRDAYSGQDLTFTAFTPLFKETIDYIFYSDALRLTSVLSPVEEEYAERTVGLPNIHFPSDHIFIGARFTFDEPDGNE